MEDHCIMPNIGKIFKKRNVRMKTVTNYCNLYDLLTHFFAKHSMKIIMCIHQNIST